MCAKILRPAGLAALLLMLLSGSGCVFGIVPGALHHASVKGYWRRDHATETARFQQLAAEEHWAAIAYGHGTRRETISRVDFARARVTHFYATSNRIWLGSVLDDGRIMAYTTPQSTQEHTFVLIDPAGERPTQKIRPSNLPESDAWPRAVLAMSERYVFYQANRGIIRYDLQTDEFMEVSRGTRDGRAWPYGGFEANGFLFVWLGCRHRPQDEKELLVFRTSPPFEQVARTPCAVVCMVGRRILLQNERRIYDYNPESGEMAHLADGRLIGNANDDAFVYCPEGDEWLTKPVLLYEFSKGRSREILQSLDLEESSYMGLWILAFTPDLKYVLLGRDFMVGAPLTPFHVHNVETGGEPAAFLNPYRDRIYIGRILKWVE